MSNSQVVVKDPFVVKNIMPKDMLENIQKYAMKMWSQNPNYDKSFGRHQWANTEELDFFITN